MLDSMTFWGLTALVPSLAQSVIDPSDVTETLQRLDFVKAAASLVVLALAWGIDRFVRTTLNRFGEGVARQRLFAKKLASFVRLGVFFVAAALVITILLGGQERALLGVLGTFGLAVGFALKDTMSSIVTGILILVDQPFQVGDRIYFGDTYGEVKEVGLRSVKVRTSDDDLVSIPNNKFLTESVASPTAGSLQMMVTVPFYISVTEDFQLARKLVYDACVTSRFVYLERPVEIELEEVARDTAFATIITCKAFVIDTQFEKAFVTDVTERVKREFRSRGIEAPYAREHAFSASKADAEVSG
ncbi:MAG: mechanosensitive ion channel family protein [Myxococcota bacterium]